MVYKSSNSNADLVPQLSVVIRQVNLSTLQCEVEDASRHSRFMVSMRNAVGLFHAFPSPNETWIVSKIAQEWHFLRKTFRQNPAITTLQNIAEPGDVILSATNNLLVTNDLVLLGNVTIKRAGHPNLGVFPTTVWTSNQTAASTINTPVVPVVLASTDTEVPLATGTSILTISTPGLYHVSFYCKFNFTFFGTYSAILEISDGSPEILAGSIVMTDKGFIQNTYNITVPTIFAFNVKQSSAGSHIFDSNIKIIRIG